MRIAFFGSSLVSAYWNGAATYYRGLIREMAARGHSLTFFEPDAYERQSHRDMPDPDWANVIVYEATGCGVAGAIDQSLANDVVIKCSGVGIFDELLERNVVELASTNRRIGFCDVDAPATLERVRNDPSDPFRTLIPRFDFVFTYGGGEPVCRRYRELGARQCTPIYNGLDPRTHHPAPPQPQFLGLLGFLGNRLPDREARFDEFYVGPARQLAENRFVLGGNGWKDRNLPKNVTYVGHVYTHQHNTFNSAPRAVLNINRESMADYGFSPATRVFEAAGAGACIISDAFEGVEQFLAPEREILIAHDGDEVCRHLKSLTPERARRIGERARERVLAQHTYALRAAQLEALLRTGKGGAQSDSVHDSHWASAGEGAE